LVDPDFEGSVSQVGHFGKHGWVNTRGFVLLVWRFFVFRRFFGESGGFPLLSEGDFAAELLGEVARGVAERGALFDGRENVERRGSEEEDVALVVALELIADVFRYGSVGGVAEVKDFVGALAAAGAWECSGGAVDGWGLGVAAWGGGVVV